MNNEKQKPSGHLEDRTINFRRRSKAKIGKANLPF